MGNKLTFHSRQEWSVGEGANVVVMCTSAGDLWAWAVLIEKVKFRMTPKAGKAILEGCQWLYSLQENNQKWESTFILSGGK